ncbi:hypothetical protein M440DRAFT_1090170 [Trichoderma longibrachiatum ATCC 18648]|uniref:Uncharacterized protein n=1 Tax=Trichoderma longibrachiatum ATCC 18648 TaxID=983965 RepID=A0A2T4BT51_TRILO|nr:hypothetical protein M440DRAFT_1090170 [Trichoderma longibrachiatum ATCC 18648]
MSRHISALCYCTWTGDGKHHHLPSAHALVAHQITDLPRLSKPLPCVAAAGIASHRPLTSTPSPRLSLPKPSLAVRPLLLSALASLSPEIHSTIKCPLPFPLNECLRRLPVTDTVLAARPHSARSGAATAHEPLEQTPPCRPPAPLPLPTAPLQPFQASGHTPPRCRPSRTYTRKPEPPASSSHPSLALFPPPLVHTQSVLCTHFAAD